MVDFTSASVFLDIDTNLSSINIMSFTSSTKKPTFSSSMEQTTILLLSVSCASKSSFLGRFTTGMIEPLRLITPSIYSLLSGNGVTS